MNPPKLSPEQRTEVQNIIHRCTDDDDMEAALFQLVHNRESLRAQLATSQARLVEVEGERDAYRAVMVQVVPGEHGEGVEQPASPEHIKAHIDYLQKEWDGAEAALAQAKQEGAKLTTGLHELASRTETDAMEIGALMTENGSLRDALDKARNGLAWYRAEHPEDESPADDEMAEEIAQALLSNTSLTAQVGDLSAQLQAGEADKRRMEWLEAKRADLHCNTSGGWWLWAKNIEVQDRASARLAIDGAIEIDADKGAGS